jgi:uncharacterized membrane protein YvbJ
MYCTKCGHKNEDNADICVECGAPLRMPKKKRRQTDECFGGDERNWENECFNLPYGRTLVGIIIGFIIIVIGLSIFLGQSIWQYLGSVVAILFGLLIIVGVLYGMRRR